MAQFDATPAAEWIGEARLAHRGVGEMPQALRPANESQAYAVQSALHRWFADAGAGAIVGHKIGCTTAAMQAYLGIDHACAGGIRAPTAHLDRLALPAGQFQRPGAECEIAFRLSADVPPAAEPYTAASITPFVASCQAAMEVVDNRYGDPEVIGAPTLIADDFFGAGCVLAPPVDDWRALDLRALAGRTLVNGQEIGRGLGSDVMDDPLAALAWLANAHPAHGIPLRADDIILTGSLVQVAWLQPGDTAEIIIDGLGRATFHLAAGNFGPADSR